MDENKEMSLVLRLKSYFNMSTVECRNEYKELSQEDKAWFTGEFTNMGLPTTMKINQ